MPRLRSSADFPTSFGQREHNFEIELKALKASLLSIAGTVKIDVVHKNASHESTQLRYHVKFSIEVRIC